MWKVIDCMEGQDGNARYPKRMPTVYGPLPVKRWVPHASDKRHVVRRSSKVAKVSPSSTKDYTANRAVLYAEWLAARDGLVIPEGCKVSVCWSSVAVPGKVKPEPRVYAVVWDLHEYREGVGHVVERKLDISIPHWDWVPRAPVEEHEDGITAYANSLTTEQYSRLLDIAHGPVPADIAALSDDELLAELEA